MLVIGEMGKNRSYTQSSLEKLLLHLFLDNKLYFNIIVFTPVIKGSGAEFVPRSSAWLMCFGIRLQC